MFTGLIETSGKLRRITPRGPGVQLTIATTHPMVRELTLGESVACDGACLTVTQFDHDSFQVDASKETMQRTTLGQRRVGDSLHLERALRVGDRLGGHIVSGHIDATGTVRSKTAVGESVRMTFSAPDTVAKYLVEKGSITIDGVSLTVNTVDESGFSVMLIPHTQGVVHLHERAVGQQVNLEADILGKYVERLLQFRGDGAKSPIDLGLLARTGFA